MINVTLMLCDYAQVVEGKLYIVGGGWSVANRLTGHIAAIFQLPYEWAQRRMRTVFALQQADGEPVLGASSIILEWEVAPQLAEQRGAQLDAPVAIPLPPIDLPNGRYRWVVTVDGEQNEWKLPFLITSQRTPLAADSAADT